LVDAEIAAAPDRAKPLSLLLTSAFTHEQHTDDRLGEPTTLLVHV
jgi:hypothetical protein